MREKPLQATIEALLGILSRHFSHDLYEFLNAELKKIASQQDAKDDAPGCGNCRFYRTGRCHRFPHAWPAMNTTDWCGEH